MRNGEPGEARKILIEVYERHRHSKEPLDRHLTLFARHYLSMIDGKPEQADHWSRRAQELGLAKFGITRVPAPSIDRMREEFDQAIRDLGEP